MVDLKNTWVGADTALFIIGANFAEKKTAGLIKLVIIAKKFLIKVLFSLIFIIRTIVKEYK
jgi:hypothetical protein